jgi:hypothetical protein
MRILLDTHLLLWSLSQPSKLSAPVRRKIDAAEVYASAASIWEISIILPESDPYEPVNCGVRFSRAAVTASLWSDVS